MRWLHLRATVVFFLGISNSEFAIHVKCVQDVTSVLLGFAMKQNITLSLDAQTLHHARQLAARRKLSVSKLLAQDLAQQVEADQRYEQAKRQALAWLAQAPLQLGGRYLDRDDAHTR